jgi:hypothetical protein
MTLTELSYYTRRAAPLVVIFFLLIFIFYYSIKLIFLLGKPQEQPTISIDPIFDKIEIPVIKDATPSSGLSFTLDTIEGKPITATAAAKVFFIPEPQPKLGYRSQILLMARQFGFDPSIGYRLEGNSAFFSDEKRKLTINFANFNFEYEYDFSKEDNLFANVILPSESEIKNKAINFLKSIDRYPEELALGKINIVYFHYNPVDKSVVLADKNHPANIVEVNFYRADIDSFPVVTSKYNASSNHLIFTFINGGIKILKAKIAFFEKYEQEFGVYPLKTGDEAYQELISGRGLIVVNNTQKKEITIKKMSLAYFDPDEYQKYLQPVYVFVGKDDFVAYVWAVRNDYLKDR